MSNFSPTARDDSRPASPSGDAGRLPNDQSRLERTSRAQRMLDRSLRLFSQGMQNLLRFLRRMFTRRSAGGGGGYDPSPGPAEQGWGQMPDSSAGRQQAPGSAAGWTQASGPERRAGREPSYIDRFVEAISKRPEKDRPPLEDALLHMIKNDAEWRQAYNRELQRGGNSLLVELANNAYWREQTSPAQQSMAHTESAGTTPGLGSAFMGPEGRVRGDAASAEGYPPSVRSDATSAFPESSQDRMPTAEEFLAAPAEGSQERMSEQEWLSGTDPNAKLDWDELFAGIERRERQSREHGAQESQPSPTPPVRPLSSAAQPGAQISHGDVPSHDASGSASNPVGRPATELQPPTASSNNRHFSEESSVRPVHTVGTEKRPLSRGPK
jgi:hypothetical protein